jgi:hypothetical protein
MVVCLIVYQTLPCFSIQQMEKAGQKKVGTECGVMWQGTVGSVRKLFNIIFKEKTRTLCLSNLPNEPHGTTYG